MKKRWIRSSGLALLLAGAVLVVTSSLAEDSTPYRSALITKWGREVTPENAWRDYPRPQLARENWQNLNGLWDYAVTAIAEKSPPAAWNGQILVPFSLESKLGGVQRLLQPDEALWYRRSVDITPAAGVRTLLNFDAVDYQCTVWLNGKEVGGHTGGNTPFSLDVSTAVRAGANELLLRVEDATEAWQQNGKQHLKPEGIWYTRVSGIWQTVWLEQVAETYIEDLHIATDATAGSITVSADIDGPAKNTTLKVTVKDGDQAVATQSGPAAGITLAIPQPKLWSPASPTLYTLEIVLEGAKGKALDRVSSYAGIRSVGKARDNDGHLRFTLNGETIFHWGPLDQGWWPDGLLTPPSADAMRSDIEFLKSAGFNMIRKHIKVEPRRYYYECDRLGMMVWQDQPSAGHGPIWTMMMLQAGDAEWPDERHQQYMKELDEMVDTLENQPCIAVWVPFNEAWGQHRSEAVGHWLQQRDPSRLVNIASGGNFFPVGDVVDYHAYPHPIYAKTVEPFKDFIKVVGEFGGHGFRIDDHLWNPESAWGYGQLPKTLDELKGRFRQSLENLQGLIKQGIAAGVYTQTTDCEIEVNGLLTYDREAVKIPAEELAAMRKTYLFP